MASSDDDMDVDAMIASHQQPGNSNDSALPDWIASHQTPLSGPVAISSDSDSEPGTLPRRVEIGDQAVVVLMNSEVQGILYPSGAAATAAVAGQNGHNPTSSQPATDSRQPAAAAAALAAVGGAHRSEVQLILPEKLIRHKVLLELEPAPHQATELSGDAGAVGRLVAAAAAAEDGCFKIDLKGVLYQASVLPLAGTALVVNMGPTDAKVESFLNDFVRIREESSYHDSGMTVEAGAGMAELLADDEENYQLGVTGDDDQSGKKPPRMKKAAASSAAAKKSSSKVGISKALKPAKAGVRKKPTSKPSKPKAAAAKAAGKTAGKVAGNTAKRQQSTGSKAVKAAAAGGGGGFSAAAKGKPAAAKKKKKADSDEDSDDASEDSDWSL